MCGKGDVIYAYLGKIKDGSSVQGGRRPCVIVNDILSEDHPIFIVSPCTKEPKGNFPFVQKIMLSYPSYIHYEQFFTVPADHSSKVVYRMSEEEISEMVIKSSFCLGTYRANILNIKKISSLLLLNNLIMGKIYYMYGMACRFSLSLDVYKREFGPLECESDMINNLSSLKGLKLILCEGGVSL